jgi:hypothetical protein
VADCHLATYFKLIRKELRKPRLSKPTKLSQRFLKQLDQMNASIGRHLEQREIVFGDSPQTEAIKNYCIDAKHAQIEIKRVFQGHLDWLQKNPNHRRRTLHPGYRKHNGNSRWMASLQKLAV